MSAHHDLIWPAIVLLVLTAGLAGAVWTATRAAVRPATVRGRTTR